MKHGKGWMKGIAAFLAIALFSVLAFSAPAADEMKPLNHVYIEFSKAFEAGNLIPYDGHVTSSDGNWVTVDSVGIEDEYKDYARNGIVWMDITDPYNTRYILPSDGERFVKGHRYHVMISVSPCRSSDDLRCFSTLTLLFINGKAGYWYPTDICDNLGIYRYTANYKVLIDGGVITQFTLPPVPQPAAGETPYFDQYSEYYDYDSGIHISYYRSDLDVNAFHGAEAWFDENTSKYLSDWDTFQAGHIYRYQVAVSANDGWYFNSTGEVRVRTSDGQEAFGADKLSQTYNNGFKDLIVSFRMPVTLEIPEVRVTGITVPDAGMYPDYTVSESGEGYHIWTYTGEDWYDGVQWRDLTLNTAVTKDANRFQAGHTYRCYALVRTDDEKYEFANDGTEPTVSAYMDGKKAEIYYNSTNDFRKVLWLYRDYTIPAEQTEIEIDRVEVLGVTGPVYGAKPSYHAAAPASADYSVWTSYETENRKNGVLWYDKTDKRYMSAGDTFALGHVYEVSVYLIPDRGYVFATRDDGRFDVAATLNGDRAEAVDTGDDTEIEITYSFTCVNAPVSSVSVSFEEPAAGREPDWSMKAYGEGYRIEDDYTGGMYFNGVYWKDDTEDRFMKPGDVFVTGHTYTVTVSLVTEEGYEFADYQNYGLTAYVNGTHADSITAWHEPEINIGLKKTYTLSSDRLPGDANEDGKVDMRDALRVVQYQEMVVPINMANADVTGDGKATIEDARLIGQYAAGWNVEMK